ncbi:BgtAcSP-31429 [Blumeria graminis f. sp. tritici]|uniref:BgtAcSP-31429 n=2 Tax=Blumeria graminis f. sp. tritici TaxID=62690 RepID=A0A9X9LAM4_BLUGR|nr:hypothetical protein BGT96224_AcSP31429 [Blumeria graminis f. sp. tritici 96224]VCU40863.1 BgtAcSP-31429 [Blumeria graminis f. sp. tritici]
MKFAIFDISFALALFGLNNEVIALPPKFEKPLHPTNKHQYGGRLEERKFDADRWNFTSGLPKVESNRKHQPDTFENYVIDLEVPPA